MNGIEAILFPIIGALVAYLFVWLGVVGPLGGFIIFLVVTFAVGAIAFRYIGHFSD